MAMAPKVTDQIQLIQFNLDKQERYNVQLPFTITCTEIEQKLIDPKGSIEINNTLDWRTQIKIDDPEYGSTVADVSLNKPFEYRGYRFFQASAITIGSASEMTLDVIPQDGRRTAFDCQYQTKRNGGTCRTARRSNTKHFFPISLCRAVNSARARRNIIIRSRF